MRRTNSTSYTFFLSFLPSTTTPAAQRRNNCFSHFPFPSIDFTNARSSFSVPAMHHFFQSDFAFHVSFFPLRSLLFSLSLSLFHMCLLLLLLFFLSLFLPTSIMLLSVFAWLDFPTESVWINRRYMGWFPCLVLNATAKQASKTSRGWRVKQNT